MNFDQYLQIKNAAEFLGVSENTLRNWTRQGKIPVYRHPINRYRLFRREDLQALLDAIEKPVRRTKKASSATSDS
jgi:DNA (cytosine-5)-methyltransferase 1